MTGQGDDQRHMGAETQTKREAIRMNGTQRGDQAQWLLIHGMDHWASKRKPNNKKRKERIEKREKSREVNKREASLARPTESLMCISYMRHLTCLILPISELGSLSVPPWLLQTYSQV